MVSYTAGFLTADSIIVGNDTYHEIMGAPVAYSTVSREFLVVWRQYADVNIFGLRLNNSGDSDQRRDLASPPARSLKATRR